MLDLAPSDDGPRLSSVSPLSSKPSPSRSSTTTPTRASVEEAFHKNIVGMLNKRGYNLRSTSSPSSCHVPPQDASEASTASTSLSIASTSVSTSLLLALREPAHGQTPLHLAVRKGDLALLDALLTNDCADGLVHLRDDCGNTALHFAAGAVRLLPLQTECVVRKLLQAGADVGATNAQGLAPLAVHVLVARTDAPEVAVALLEHGADPNALVDGGPLLQLAARRQLDRICTALVAFGAAFTNPTSDGCMVYEAALPRQQAAMLRGLPLAPPLLPVGHRSRCMHCHNALRGGRHRVSQSVKRWLGIRSSSIRWNCYHCGLLFCSQCLRATAAADLLPPAFVRSRLDDLGFVKLCPLCRVVLREREGESHGVDQWRKQSFSSVSMVTMSMPGMGVGVGINSQPRNARFESIS